MFLQLVRESMHYFLSTLLFNHKGNLVGTLILLWLYPYRGFSSASSTKQKAKVIVHAMQLDGNLPHA